MGQHKTNPVAMAAKRGEISKSDRQPRVKTQTHTERMIVAGEEYHERNTITRKGRRKVVTGVCLVRAVPKVRGKAHVKRAKRQRRVSETLAKLAA